MKGYAEQPTTEDLGATATLQTSSPDNPAKSGPTGRAQQGNQPRTRQTGPIVDNKPHDDLLQLILPPNVHGNRIAQPVPTDAGGPVGADSGLIWPRLDYSENLQLSAPVAQFTAAQLNTFSAHYVSFAVPHTLKNRKIYAYINAIFPNVGAFGAVVAQINLWRNSKILTSFPLSLYNNALNNAAASQSIPFIAGTGLAGYDSIGLSLKNLQAGESSPVSLVPLICAINIDKISVDLDNVNTTATNLSSLRIWVGCISY